MDAVTFLTTVFQYAESGYSQVFALPTTQAKAVPVIDFTDVSAAIQQFQGQNIYFSPGITSEPKNSKLSNPDIIGIPALWADVDIFHPAHAKQNLPRTVEEAYTLIPECLPPSIIVHSGHGLQFWWLLRECWMFDTPEEKQQAQDILTRLQGYVRQRAQAQGWHLDSVQDLCRVMRLPGTVNIKIPSEPVWAQVIDQSDIRYNPSEIDEILPALEQTAAASGKTRTAAFERRPTDGPASYMLQNCMFMQHCQLNAKTLSYGDWLAALTNIVRATDGIQAAHGISALDPDRYKPADTDKKIDEALGAMNPQNCDYVRTALGFQGCPAGGCGVQAPCGWSLGKVPQARAVVRAITVPTAETVYQPDVLQAVAVLEKDAPAEYDQFYQRLSGQVNKNTFKKELAKLKKEQSGLQIIDGGGVADSKGERWLSQTVPDVPIDLIMPGNPSNYASWVFKNNGVAAVKVNEQGNTTYNKATYMPIIINERINNIDTAQAKASICFKTNRGNWRSVILPKSTILDAKKIMCLADSDLNITTDMAKVLTKWLSELEAANMNTIPERIGVSGFGWRNNNTEFIVPGMVHSYTLDTDDVAPQSVINGYIPAGDHNIWLQSMTDVIKNNIARFILSVAFAAPLLKIIGQRTFCVHNWGDSRDGKSAAQYIAMSVWGKPDTIKILASSSETGIERMASLCSDLPLCVSELETLDEYRRTEFESKIPYMVTEGKGKQRGTIKGLQQVSSWRTIMLTNAESSIVKDNSKGGIITRILEIRGGPFAGNQELASYLYGIVDENYGHAGRIFLSNLISSNHAELKETYNKTRIALRKKYPNKIDSHLDAMAALTIASEKAGMWVFSETKEVAISRSLEMAYHIIEEQLICNEDADDSERAWQWLQGWIAANDFRFGTHGTGSIAGYTDNDYIYIIKAELSKAMKFENLNPDKFYRKWADQGRIPYTSNGDKRTIAVRGKVIGGARPWCIRIKKENS